jgi:hypothetical protein
MDCIVLQIELEKTHLWRQCPACRDILPLHMTVMPQTRNVFESLFGQGVIKAEETQKAAYWSFPEWAKRKLLQSYQVTAVAGDLQRDRMAEATARQSSANGRPQRSKSGRGRMRLTIAHEQVLTRQAREVIMNGPELDPEDIENVTFNVYPGVFEDNDMLDETYVDNGEM